MNFKEFVNKHYLQESTAENYATIIGILILSTILLAIFMFFLIYTGKTIASLEQQVHLHNYCNGGYKIDSNYDQKTDEFVVKTLNKDLKIPKFLYVLWCICLIIWFSFVKYYSYLFDKFMEFRKSYNGKEEEKNQKTA